jgi:hypothetical protein
MKDSHGMTLPGGRALGNREVREKFRPVPGGRAAIRRVCELPELDPGEWNLVAAEGSNQTGAGPDLPDAGVFAGGDQCRTWLCAPTTLPAR